MANREELGIIRGARGGDASAQLELGKRYLAGSAGLPQSLPTALHWLDRAAKQDCAEAWTLIGSHIPLETARAAGPGVARWYALAWEAGVARAGLVLAQLVLAPGARPDPALQAQALGALAAAAAAGQGEAQWLLAQVQDSALPAAGAAPARLHALDPRWARPDSTDPQLDQAWEARQYARYLQRALPLARRLLQAGATAGTARQRPSPGEVRLLSRCARLVAGGIGGHDVGEAELHRLTEMAASEQDRHAQLAMGLWCARMRIDGRREGVGEGSANFKKAIRWLTLAAEQGLAEAWYALSRIYIKPEFSQRNIGDAQRFLERAAEMGYRDAQLECGASAWRARRENENNDVRAAYWLQKAAQQGCPLATQLLRKIAPRAEGALYTAMGELAVPRGVAASHPLLAARLELAALFRLSRAEALLLDVRAADRGHCLVVDIRGSYGRSRRRLVLVQTAAERQALDRIGRQFEQVDAGPNGVEGNYRQRLYRLKTVVPQAAGADSLELAA